MECLLNIPLFVQIARFWGSIKRKAQGRGHCSTHNGIDFRRTKAGNGRVQRLPFGVASTNASYYPWCRHPNLWPTAQVTLQSLYPARRFQGSLLGDHSASKRGRGAHARKSLTARVDLVSRLCGLDDGINEGTTNGEWRMTTQQRMSHSACSLGVDLSTLQVSTVTY
jgi:hypothetical protein